MFYIFPTSVFSWQILEIRNMSKRKLAHENNSSEGYPNIGKHWVVSSSPAPVRNCKMMRRRVLPAGPSAAATAGPGQCLEWRHVADKFTYWRKYTCWYLAGHSLLFESKWDKCFGMKRPAYGAYLFSRLQIRSLVLFLWWAISLPLIKGVISHT